MRYLLDANSVIALLKDAISPPARRVRRYAPREVGVSALVIHELYYGAFKSQRVEGNVARVDGLQFPVLEFDQDDARHAERSERSSRRRERPWALTTCSSRGRPGHAS